MAPNPELRRYHKLTCAACRRKKGRCDGAHPLCLFCRAHGITCVYDKPASVAYVRHLEREVDRLSGETRELRQEIPLSCVSSGIAHEPSLRLGTVLPLVGHLQTHFSDILTPRQQAAMAAPHELAAWHLTPEQYARLVGFYSQTHLLEEALAHTFLLFLCSLTLKRFLASARVPENTDLPLLDELKALYRRVHGHPLLLFENKERWWLGLKSSELLTEALFDHISHLLVQAFFQLLVLEVVTGGSVRRLWLYLGTCHHLVETMALATEVTSRMVWAVYSWDTFIAVSTGRQRHFHRAPLAPPHSIEFNLFDLVEVEVEGSRVYIDTWPLVTAFCRMMPLLADVCDGVHRLELVRRRLLSLTRHVVANVPSDLFDTHHLPDGSSSKLPFSSCVLIFSCSLQFVLVSETFTQEGQQQARAARIEAVDTRDGPVYVDRDEHRLMMESAASLTHWIQQDIYRGPAGAGIKPTRCCVIVVGPLVLLLRNSRFRAFAGEDDCYYLVALLSALLMLLCLDTITQMGTLQDVVQSMRQWPLVVLDQPEMANLKPQILSSIASVPVPAPVQLKPVRGPPVDAAESPLHRPQPGSAGSDDYAYGEPVVRDRWGSWHDLFGSEMGMLQRGGKVSNSASLGALAEVVESLDATEGWDGLHK